MSGMVTVLIALAAGASVVLWAALRAGALADEAALRAWERRKR